MEQPTLTFNLDVIFEPARKGIARAYVFVGLAVNAATDSRLTEFHLPGKGQFRFVPDASSPEILEGHKQEFANWVVGNALRETIEAFGITLDLIFEACLIGQDAANGRSSSHVKVVNKFRRAGVDGKLRELNDRFGIKSGVTDEFRSLTRARNCLSHRRGFVGVEDCTDASGTKLIIELWRWRVFAKQPDGSEIDIDDNKLYRGGIEIKDGGVIAMQLAQRQLEFPKSSFLRLEPRDLKDVFATFLTAVENLTVAFRAFIDGLNARRGGQKN